MPIKAAVMGLGNIGRYAIEALEIQPDFTCVGVIRRKESLGKDAHDLRGVPEYASLADLEAVSGKPDVVLLCAPSRKIPEVAGGQVRCPPQPGPESGYGQLRHPRPDCRNHRPA